MGLRKFCASIGLWTAATALPAIGHAAPNDAGPVLQPIKPWVVDYADAQCAAGRDFGEVAKPITLVIRPMPKGDTYELQLIRKKPAAASAEEDQGSVDFGTGPIAASVLHFGNVAEKLDIFQFRITATQMEQARPASAVTFRNAHGPDVSLSLSSMQALLTRLAECNSDLQRYWNIDNKGPVKASQPSRGDVRRVFTSDYYPADALSAQDEGTAQFLLLIDTSGKIASCFVLKPSGVPLLDAMGCQVIRKRAKFTPARDAAGNPVRDSYVTPPISWRIAG